MRIVMIMISDAVTRLTVAGLIGPQFRDRPDSARFNKPGFPTQFG